MAKLSQEVNQLLLILRLLEQWFEKVRRSGMSKIIVGAWRDEKSGPMQVVSGAYGKEKIYYEAPIAGRLDTEMKSFLEWFNAEENIDPVIKAALAHLWFVTIHPFDDGNGRIARAIADMSLARSETAHSAFTACQRKSALSEKPITTCWKKRRRTGSISRHGLNGF